MGQSDCRCRSHDRCGKAKPARRLERHSTRFSVLGNLVALFPALLLVGCAHVAEILPTDGLGFEARNALLAKLSAWQMQGRLAVKVDSRAFQGSYSWQQEGPRLHLTVRGPFGRSVLDVSGTPAKLAIDARGEKRILTDPEADLSQLLGWWMPVESLRYWLLGIPDPRFTAAMTQNSSMALASLDQRQWHISYRSYQLGNAILVPRSIVMTHDNLEFRLTIDDWLASGLELKAADHSKYRARQP